ncbi:MAG: hypothetical protein Q9M08_00775 [Mariprofundus sp.]|nr:hypothetical protein [Mariprofundus sp.]
MFSTIRENLAPRHLGLAALCILAWVFIALFRYDNYGIEESAALDLLLNWSIVHQIASPVAFFGVPDLRAILFVPLDMHWVGSLIAVKVYTMFFLFGTALLLYNWAEECHGSESSMIATALLLIAPITLMQTDAIGSGIFLLWAFAVAAIFDDLMHASERTAPSWLFLQMLMCAFAVSLHPMGLALPLVVIWRWVREPVERKKAHRMIAAIVAATAIMLLLRWGWYGMDAATANPLNILADALLGSPILHAANSWGMGLIIADLGIAAMIATLFMKKLNIDSTSLMLIVASAIGALHADHVWVLIYWATTLYLGVPLLIKLNERIGWRGIAGQRGGVLVVVMILVVLSTMVAKNTYATRQMELKSDTDKIISVLQREAENAPIDQFIAASQWPARTLLVTRRDVLPLPPTSADIRDFEAKIKGITHIAFNPQQKAMHDLARNMAALSHKYETIALMPGGVVVKLKQTASDTDENINHTVSH